MKQWKKILVYTLLCMLFLFAAACSSKKDTSGKVSNAPPPSYNSTADFALVKPEGIPDQEFNTEEYKTIKENRIMKTSTSPLSTFSIDVDTASYSNTRRFLEDGQMPPEDAVRIEELINYFSYDLPEPSDGLPFSITTELSRCPWNNENYLVMIALQGKKVQQKDLPLSNLVFLLDVSGSMDDPMKLPLLKSSFKLLVEQLGIVL
jgi:Ca-activated chloride channel family protein